MPQAITYCRVSSEEQALKDISIPAQRKAIHRWAANQTGLEVVRDFVDQGISAYAPADKRPGFCEMVAFCRKHDVDLILVHKLDRFSRNREESILFKSLLRRHGVRVQSITETYDPDTPQGFLYEGMIEVINQFYSMNLATETIKGMRENAERGYHNGGRTPYGYRLATVVERSREHKRLVPGPDEEVAMVREIFRLATDGGMGIKAIANELNARGVPGPTGRLWNSSAVGHMLGNRVYVGDQVWWKSRKKGRTGREKQPEDKWIVTEDAHEALIDRETFDKRQELAASRRFIKKGSKRHAVKYLLGRLMVCERCGANFVGRRHKYTSRKTGEVTYRYRYYCGSYLSKGPSVCPPRGIDRDWADDLVLTAIQARLGTKGGLLEMERRIAERIEARRKVYGDNRRTLEAKLADCDRRIANYFAAIGDGVDAKTCREHIAALSEKRAQLEAEAEILRDQDYYEDAKERNLALLRRFAASFEDGFDRLPFGARRQVVLYFIKGIVVTQRDTLDVTLRVPIDNAGIKLLTDELNAVLDAPEGLSAGSLQSGEARGAIRESPGATLGSPRSGSTGACGVTARSPGPPSSRRTRSRPRPGRPSTAGRRTWPRRSRRTPTRRRRTPWP